jgi:hypothetical protein
MKSAEAIVAPVAREISILFARVALLASAYPCQSPKARIGWRAEMNFAGFGAVTAMVGNGHRPDGKRSAQTAPLLAHNRACGEASREMQSAKQNPAHGEPDARSETSKSHRDIRGPAGVDNGLCRLGLQVFRRGLTSPSIGDNLICDLLPFVEAVQPRALDGADMHEDIFAAVIRLDKAKAFLAVEPLHSSLRHASLLSSPCFDGRARARPAW